jgi:hypothetical protein
VQLVTLIANPARAINKRIFIISSRCFIIVVAQNDPVLGSGRAGLHSTPQPLASLVVQTSTLFDGRYLHIYFCRKSQRKFQENQKKNLSADFQRKSLHCAMGARVE